MYFIMLIIKSAYIHFQKKKKKIVFSRLITHGYYYLSAWLNCDVWGKKTVILDCSAWRIRSLIQVGWSVNHGEQSISNSENWNHSAREWSFAGAAIGLICPELKAATLIRFDQRLRGANKDPAITRNCKNIRRDNEEIRVSSPDTCN